MVPSMMFPPRARLVASCLLALSGLPLYLLLDRTQWLPPLLRDRPWPLELLVVGGAAATVAHCVHALRARRGRALAVACALAAVASLAAFVAMARFALHQLPPSPAELAVGAIPEFTLPDGAGRPVTLSSLRGAPTLLLFYRGVF